MHAPVYRSRAGRKSPLIRSQCGVSHPAGTQSANERGDRLIVFIELRDVNDPGSTDRPAFFPEPDLLACSYFQTQQAAEKLGISEKYG